MAEPASELPHAAAAEAASLDLANSSLVFAVWARWYVSPKTGARTAREAVWVKMVPRAIADGLTGGRSGHVSVSAQSSLDQAGIANTGDSVSRLVKGKRRSKSSFERRSFASNQSAMIVLELEICLRLGRTSDLQ